MALYYLDTSALVKLFVREPGSATVIALARSESGHQIAVLSIAPVEFMSAVARRQRAGTVTAAQIEQLEYSMRRILARFVVQPVTDSVVGTAIDLAKRHALRAYDALQLAGCHALRAGSRTDVTLVCADRDLNAAAEREGLAVLDPAATS